MKINMDYQIDYLTSIAIGIFIGSLILFIGRLFNFPITGIILAILISSLIAAFIYNPSNKKETKHRSLRGTGASFILGLLFSTVLIAYYVPKVNNLIGNTDLTLGIAILVIVLITVLGGIVLGSIGGSIGSTFRDMASVISIEKENRKKVKKQ